MSTVRVLALIAVASLGEWSAGSGMMQVEGRVVPQSSSSSSTNSPTIVANVKVKWHVSDASRQTPARFLSASATVDGGRKVVAIGGSNQTHLVSDEVDVFDSGTFFFNPKKIIHFRNGFH
jgi:hypothetical protein